MESIIDGRADICARSFYLGSLDIREPREGPWHEELFVAHSPDGRTIDLTRKQLIKSPGAVPDTIRGADGRFYMFYGAADLDAAREVVRAGGNLFAKRGIYGYGALGLMVSDDGVTFQEELDFEIRGLVRGMVVDPDVVQLPDGRYRLYYVGLPVPEMLSDKAWDDGARHTLWYAESTDLVHWSQVGMASLGPNADPTVVCEADGSCVMSATGLDFGYSTDGGQQFTFEAKQEPWGFAPELLRLPDCRLRLFYNSKVRGGALNSAISSDGGETWEDEGEVLPGRLVEAVSFVPDPAGGYLVYFHYWKEGYSGDSWDPDKEGKERFVPEAPPPEGGTEPADGG